MRKFQSSNQKEYTYLIVVIVFFLLFASALLSNFSFNVLFKARFGEVFFGMFKRLIAGDVSIEPSLLVGERYIIHGKFIPYFLPFPAVIRGFLSIFKIGAYPIPSILMAITLYSVSIYFLFKKVLKVLGKGRNAILVAWYPFFLLPMVSLFVEASVYWESIIWALALFITQAFFFISFLYQPKSVKKYLLLLISGLVLFTRPTYLVGSCVLVVILFLWDLKFKNYSIRSLLPYCFFIFAVLLLAFLNYQRWGDPLEFHPFKYYEEAGSDERGRMAAGISQTYLLNEFPKH